MSRDPLARMDVDTHWAYHRKVRKLQARYPDRWPIYWSAYMALLGEAWAKGNRKLTLEEAWCPALPCTVDEAFTSLRECDIIDKAGRVPLDSWKVWVEPAIDRVKGKSDSGQRAAHKRWHDPNVPFESCERCATAMGTHSVGNAPRHPRHPSTPHARGRARGNGSSDPDEATRDDAIARAKATIEDPATSEDRREVARFQLRRLGAA